MPQRLTLSPPDSHPFTQVCITCLKNPLLLAPGPSTITFFVFPFHLSLSLTHTHTHTLTLSLSFSLQLSLSLVVVTDCDFGNPSTSNNPKVYAPTAAVVASTDLAALPSATIDAVTLTFIPIALDGSALALVEWSPLHQKQ